MFSCEFHYLSRLDCKSLKYFLNPANIAVAVVQAKIMVNLFQSTGCQSNTNSTLSNNPNANEKNVQSTKSSNERACAELTYHFSNNRLIILF